MRDEGRRATVQMMKFANIPGGVRNYSEYFEWDEADKLFKLRASLVVAAGQILWDAGKQSTVGLVVALLKARFGSENEAERFRAKLRSRNELKVSRCKNSIKISVG